ncbi:lytic transglycosylase domain-containing protein [Thiocystis violascens]|uniref:Soluble lytic murein transglycosylase-like protein n=1 Tax=Thiocystis violascens (strain ATCC 17096 / DSM 198 / 6111) TaxID=765911 RepID=I3YHE5_THIV6|nr:transglycosylase SLT domain-containing protein [Thiocystis violascens]AFL76413.1 soluble lytic murein transglycosylase-like protein [Thiocystis violascens DSM 198]
MRPESIHARYAWVFPLSLLVLIILNGCAGSGGERDSGGQDTVQIQRDPGGSSTFPVPPEIQDNVDFWRHVYGIWSRGEVAIHDDEHLGVIYEVSRIPGPIQAGYSASQKAWLDSRTGYHASRLKMLEERIRTGQTLTPGDKELLAKFEKDGGVAALYGASDRLRAQRGLRERFRRSVEISGRYEPAFREIMKSHGLPEDLAYIPHVESSYQTNAKSSAGACGVWQFMPATGRSFMTVNDHVDERYDPILSADGAARYLSQAHRRLGSWPLAITSYNHGQGGMAKARSQHGNDIGRIVEHYDGKAFGFASRNYYAEFIAAREVASNAKRYFPEGVNYEAPWAYDRLVLHHSMPAEHVARHYGASASRLADLNLHWRGAVRDGRASLPAGSTVWLPQGSMKRVASQPPPVSVPIMLAREPKVAPKQEKSQTAVAMAKTSPSTARPTPAIRTASSGKKPAPEPRVAANKPKPDTRTAANKPKPTPETRAANKVRYHVVKPQETLYRVALLNGLSVAELRRLNKMSSNDNNIQAGQKLKVGI